MILWNIILVGQICLIDAVADVKTYDLNLQKSRKGVPKTAVLITDGDPQEMYKCQEQSKAAYRDGINLFIVGTYFICYRRNPRPLLPPANEVWDKVTFLHLCVILFTGRGGDWLPSMHHKSHDQGAFASRGSASRGVCIWERSASGGDLHRGRGALGTHTRALRDMVNK